MKANFLFLFFFFLFESINCFSQTGYLDSTFNSTGIVVFPEGGYSVAVQPDGKILSGGASNYGFVVVRYNADGSLDKNFGYNGKDSIVTGTIGRDHSGYMALQPDGKILLSGWGEEIISGETDFSVCRFNANGRVDSSFNGNGGVLTSFAGLSASGYAIALQPDGKIVQVGEVGNILYNYVNSTADFGIVRYNADGTLDNSFGNGGEITTSLVNKVSGAMAVAIQPDGKIIAGGYSGSMGGNNLIPSWFAMVRYNTDGSLDSSFGKAGKVTTYFGAGGLSGSTYEVDWAWAIALQPDGKIILAGTTYFGSDSVCFARYNMDGSLDSSFGSGGKVVIPRGSESINSICLQPDGKIILAGGDNNNHPNSFDLIRCNTDGSIDSSFGKNGFAPNVNLSDCVAQSVATQADGKIVVSGYKYFDEILLRFLSGLNTGVLNFSSPQNPLLIYPNPISKQATLQYTLAQNESISLTLTDMPGRQVQTFFTNQQREQGPHKEELQLSNTLAAGNYILSISNGHSSQGVKVTVVR